MEVLYHRCEVWKVTFLVYCVPGLWTVSHHCCTDLHTYIHLCKGGSWFCEILKVLALSLATALADVRTLTDQPRIVTTRRSLLHLIPVLNDDLSCPWSEGPDAITV